MRGQNVHPLSDASKLCEPVLADSVTVADYLNCLTDPARKLADNGDKKALTNLRVFRRWVESRYGPSMHLALNEQLIQQCRDDLSSGKFKSERGAIYASMVRQVPAGIARIHNKGYELMTARPRTKQMIRRALFTGHVYQRLHYFSTLTPRTQHALLAFEEYGYRAKTKGGIRSQVMTWASRRTALAELFTLLRRLELNGIEQVTKEQVSSLVPVPDPDDAKYRRMIRQLHAVQPVFRFCVDEDLLPIDPLATVPHATFSNHASRYFVPPDDLARLLDISGLDCKAAARTDAGRRRIVDRLTSLVLVDTGLRLNELAGINRDQVNETSSGKYSIALMPEGQKMSGKNSDVIFLIYDATNALMDSYLRMVWHRYRVTRLLVDTTGQPASGQAIVDTVKRECGGRLGLICQDQCGRKKEKAVSPHDLRRTFGTCNASPLGLQLTIHEIAVRLRIDPNTAYKHYFQQNPLIKQKHAEEYGRRSSSGKIDRARALLNELADCGVGADVLSVVCQDIERKEKIRTTEDNPSATPTEWIPEKAALDTLTSKWNLLPNLRRLRDHFRSRSITARKGPNGSLLYDAQQILRYAEDYLPVRTTNSRLKYHAIDIHDCISIGDIRLVPHDDGVRILMSSP